MHFELGPVLPPTYLFIFGNRHFRQQPAAEKDHKRNAGDGQWQSHQGRVKHGDGAHSGQVGPTTVDGITYQSADDQVGGRADQGAGAAQNRSETQWDEKVFGRQATGAGQVLDNRDHHGDQRRVV